MGTLGSFSRSGNVNSPPSLTHVLHGVLFLPLLVAINLIVQHIQDILNGDLCRWQRGSPNSHARGLKRAISEQADLTGKRMLLEPSSRPH